MFGVLFCFNVEINIRNMLQARSSSDVEVKVRDALQAPLSFTESSVERIPAPTLCLSHWHGRRTAAFFQNFARVSPECHQHFATQKKG